MSDTLILQAYALYKATHFTGFDNNNQIGIEVFRLQGFSPRYAWVKRYLVPGQNQVQYLLTFEPSSAEVTDANVIQGVYIEIDGQGVVIDCISCDNFTAAANGTGTITRRYAAGVTAFTTPTPACYTVSRIDDGSVSAANQVVMDYVTQYIGNVEPVSSVTGTSTYRLYAFSRPTPVGGDIVATC